MESSLIHPSSQTKESNNDTERSEEHQEEIVEEIPSSSNNNTKEKKSPESSNLSTPLPPLPFPNGHKKKILDEQFGKFLSMFNKLTINIPFSDALKQMPIYEKFMKDILTNKRAMLGTETVQLTEEISAVLLRNPPPKLGDPGLPIIPCSIGDFYCGSGLCDLGASINLMPLSTFNKLGIGKCTPTTMQLQLADRSLVFPKGKVEDLVVTIQTFVFPADFVVIDMEEDSKVPLILGRLFLRTARTLIDVESGKIILRFHDEKVEFDMSKVVKRPAHVESIFTIDIVDSILQNNFLSLSDRDALNIVLLESYDDEQYKIPEIADKDGGIHEQITKILHVILSTARVLRQKCTEATPFS